MVTERNSRIEVALKEKRAFLVGKIVPGSFNRFSLISVNVEGCSLSEYAPCKKNRSVFPQEKKK
jgi:hypothetical protein